MQITHVEVTPIELGLHLPYRAGQAAEIDRVTVIFVRIETREGRTAWGCTAFDPSVAGETADQVIRTCRACAERARDLNPLNTEYALEELAQVAGSTLAALCAFDLAFHDLLGLATGLPLYRLLGGYRDRIQTSATISIASIKETVELARDRARQGFRIFKIKGGLHPEEDVQRVRAVAKALPGLTLRLDADGGYTVRQALDVARALDDVLEMLEQPTPANDLDALYEVTQYSTIPVLADQSVVGPKSALEVAARRAADGLSTKLAACGGIRCARQIDNIARAALLTTMVGCINEPALLTAAGLSFALSSPNVLYGDLDGHMDLIGDPSVPSFRIQDGWLIASESPGLGCTVSL